MQPAWGRIFQMVGGSAWEAHTGRFERRITVHGVQERFRPWDTLQVLWRLHTDLQHALHDGGLGGDGDRWRMASTRAGVERHDSVRIGLAQPLEPLAHEGGVTCLGHQPGLDGSTADEASLPTRMRLVWR